MTTHRQILQRHHSHWFLALATVASVLLIFANRMLWDATGESLAGLSGSMRETSALAARDGDLPVTYRALPFTFRQVEMYFTDALQEEPMRLDEHAIVYQSGPLERLRREEEYRISVIQDGPQVGVKFALKGDYGMQLVREFIEAPWIRASESEYLYYMLDQGQGTRIGDFGRFKVRLTISETREWLTIAFRFAPPDVALADSAL